MSYKFGDVVYFVTNYGGIRKAIVTKRFGDEFRLIFETNGNLETNDVDLNRIFLTIDDAIASRLMAISQRACDAMAQLRKDHPEVLDLRRDQLVGHQGQSSVAMLLMSLSDEDLVPCNDT